MDATKQEGAVSVKQELKYRQTYGTESIGESWSGTKDLPSLLALFWDCPFNVVRERCLGRLAGKSVREEETARWLETRIPLVLSADGGRFPFGVEYWKCLLSFYLFNSTPELRTRAVELAISLFLSQESDGVPDVRPTLSKMIFGAIRKYPELYWAPSVPEFLETSLAHENWTIVERALELICRAEDTSFLPHVIELLRKAGEEKEKKEDFKTKVSEERFAAAKSLGVLREAVRHLRICKTEQNEDVGKFQNAVQDFFYRNCRNSGLREHPNVHFECPEEFSPTNEFFVAVGVSPYHGTWNPDAVCLDLFLEKCVINLKVAFDGISGFNEVDIGFKKFNDECTLDKLFEAFTRVSGSTRKVIRLRVAMMYLHNKNGWEEIATLTRYIHRAE